MTELVIRSLCEVRRADWLPSRTDRENRQISELF